MQLVVPGAVCITAHSLVKDSKLLHFLIEWTFNSLKLNLQKEHKHMWWECLNWCRGWIYLCRTMLPGWQVYFGRVFIVSQALCGGRMRLGTHFSLSLCMPGAPLRRTLKVTVVFFSKNAWASGHTDMWEGKAVTKNTRWSWVTPEQGNYWEREGICRQKESKKL